MKCIFCVIVAIFLISCESKLPYEAEASKYLEGNLQNLSSLNEILINDHQFHDACFMDDMSIKPTTPDPFFGSGTMEKYTGKLPQRSCYRSQPEFLIIEPLTIEKCYKRDCDISFIFPRSKLNIPTCTVEMLKSPGSECMIESLGGWFILYSVY